MTEARQRRFDHFYNNLLAQSARSLTPSARKAPDILASPRSQTPTYKSFASRLYHSPSRVFDDSPVPPVVQRKSLTYSSTIFAPPLPHKIRYNPYKPVDASSADLFGSETPKQSRTSTPKCTSGRSLSPPLSERSTVQDSSKMRSKTVSSMRTPSEASAKGSQNHTERVPEKQPELTIATQEAQALQTTEEESRPQYREEIEAKKTWWARRRKQLDLLSTQQYSTPKKSNKIYSLNVSAMHSHMMNSIDLGPMTEPSLIDLSVSGLSQAEDEFTVKKACSGFHVVSMKTDHDSILGHCKGTASLKLRVHKPEEAVDKISLNFAAKGWSVNRTPKRVGRHNSFAEATNRSFLDNRLQLAERRLHSNEISHRAMKLKSLQTTADLFGNSEGTGKWTKNWQEVKAREPRRRQVTELQRWDALLK
eukprot:CAMPEP_0204908786 /NCGR_PEP_ID=MMETSP1397-20131031/7664_1 /ASSEMBLY_ACC=CAM_ASM_000891 /TAXON_ID=49980 /ORGANISM="Climacostomum Climacostomum virens, Strain Stock W-24" /LENGTH=420 /DNA_ID=CAMNT_0052078425 /DNA_START=313 /DNA_END=1572 /DNA_ORIENTATION=+